MSNEMFIDFENRIQKLQQKTSNFIESLDK